MQAAKRALRLRQMRLAQERNNENNVVTPDKPVPTPGVRISKTTKTTKKTDT